MVGTLRPPRAAGPAAGSVPLGLHYPMCAEPMQPNRTQSRRHRPRTRDPPDTDLVTPTRGGTLWFFRDPWRDSTGRAARRGGALRFFRDPWRHSAVLPRPVEALYGSGCTPWRRSAVLPRPVEGLYGSSATRRGTLRVGLHAVEATGCGEQLARDHPTPTTATPCADSGSQPAVRTPP